MLSMDKSLSIPTDTVRPLRILIAPNAFKNAIDAAAAAAAISKGLMQSRLYCICTSFPIGDGGDGTCDLLIRQAHGVTIPVTVRDPLGRMIEASYGLIEEGRVAVIEMADASGVRLLQPAELNPLRATSYGTGELITAALDKGVRKIIIGMGGSATVDGGTGMLDALGVRFLDREGKRLAGVIDLETIDLSQLDPRVQTCEFIVLCDVENRLLGPEGAAAVFGPQKGARPEDLPKLEAALTRYSEIALQVTGTELSTLRHGGTAGGAAAGLHTFLGATLVTGIDYFLDSTGFDAALSQTDIVITGEGSIDEQTLQGKGPYGVASRAKARGIPVIGLAGQLPLESTPSLQSWFDVLLPIGNEPADLAMALSSTGQNLQRTAEEIGNLMSMTFGK
jgi:glycerate kinase